MTVDLVYRASALAQELHAEQTRKTSGQSYFDAHLQVVAILVAHAGGVEEVVAAAYLHDAIEDQPDREPEKRILEACGSDVLNLVRACTEPGTGVAGAPKPPWRERKEAYLAHLHGVSVDALLISVADKLSSLRELVESVTEKGDDAYLPFNANKESILWFHQELAKAFRGCYAYHEYDALTEIPHGLLALIDEFEERVDELVGMSE